MNVVNFIFRDIGATNISTLREIRTYAFCDFKLDIYFNPRGGLPVGICLKIGLSY